MKVVGKPKIKAPFQIKSKGVDFKIILEKAVYFVLGFILSQSSTYEGYSPFGISLVAVSAKKNFLFSAAGAVLGYFIFSDSLVATRCFAALIIAGLGALAADVFDLKHHPHLPMAISFLAVLATGVVVNLQLGGNMGDYALTLGESTLAMGGSYFFFKTIRCSKKRLRFKALPIADLTCVIISGALALMSLSRFTISGISPARILSALIILTALRYGGDRWAVTLAICLGFAMGLSQENAMFILGAYSFSTLIATLFSPLGSLGCSISFVLSMAFFSITAGLGSLSLCCFWESLIAGVIFLLIPPALSEKIENFWEQGPRIAPDGSLRQSLVVRLRFAASAMATVSENVKDVSEKIEALSDNVDIKDKEFRMVASDQFFSIADMLSDLAFEFDEAEQFDAKAAGRIRRLLGESDIYPQNISVIVDSFRRSRVEIVMQGSPSGLDSPGLNTEIGRICGRYFEKGRITKFGKETMLSFTEKPVFTLCVGFSQHCAEGTLCGDTVKIVNDGRGHSILIISDGMGKGARAALDGAMGAGLLSKLLSAGYGFDSSLKVVNSALLVKSSEESLATIDAVSVDLFSGKCEFFKAGAPESYIIRDREITKCQLSSMPVGILRGIEFAKRTTLLKTGDRIVLLSDGITDVCQSWIEPFLKYGEEKTEQELADAIIQFALQHSDERHTDDMSVIVATMKNNQE